MEMLEKNNNCQCNCKCGKTPASQTKAESLQTHRELFEEFYSGVTLHGFRFLFEGKWIRRLIWFTICSCVFAFSVYLSYGLLNDFFSRKMNTGVSRTYTESALDFPTVTICPLTSLSSRKLNNLPLVNYTAETFVQATQGVLEEPTNVTRKFLSELEDIGINSLVDYADFYQLTYDEIITECYFYEIECKRSWLSRRLLWGQSLCLEFNPFLAEKDSLKAPIRTEGFLYEGLLLYFDLGGADRINSVEKNALVLTIENYGNRDDELVLNERLTLNPGEEAHIKLTEKELKMLPSPYKTHCGKRALKFVDPKMGYTQGICVIDCVADLIYSKCGCVTDDYKALMKPGND